MPEACQTHCGAGLRRLPASNGFFSNVPGGVGLRPQPLLPSSILPGCGEFTGSQANPLTHPSSFRLHPFPPVPIHVIRLRGPWECDAVEDESVEDESVACARYTRRFGLPTNLAPSERVLVVIESAGCSIAASINDKPLGEIAIGVKRAEFDITDHLLPRNILRLDVDLPQNESHREQPPAAAIGEVRLEIRS
jgi:hypothetical protein